jgi:hypothetical protein
MKLTVEPDTEHTLGDPAENATASPDDADAVTVYVGPPTVAPLGAVEVKLMVCGFLVDANVVNEAFSPV